MKKVFVYLPARNEEQNLATCLESLLHQTLKPTILVINDGSIDSTEKICVSYHVKIINLPFHIETYISNISLNWKLATVVNNAFPLPKDTDYMMAMGSDIILPIHYIEELVRLMEADSKLVIASGVIKGEKCLRSHPRGAGRMFKTWFWNQYIHKYPENFTWESYPLYKAASLGLKTQSFPNLIYQTIRSTRNYKSHYGYAMRELGYFPPFAIGKSLVSMLFSPKQATTMLIAYLRSPFKAYDQTIRNYLQLHQINRILHFKESLKILTSKIQDYMAIKRESNGFS